MSSESLSCLVVLIVAGLSLFGLIAFIARSYRNNSGGSLVSDFLFMLIALPIFLYYSSVCVNWARLNASGVAAEATVQTRDVSYGEATIYTISYAYQVDGKTYAAKQEVRESAYNELSEGSRVPVRYLASSPGTSHLAGPYATRFPGWEAMMVVLFGSFTGVLVRQMVQHSRSPVASVADG